MNEHLLLYLWQCQEFHKQFSTLDTGSNIEIVFPGINNVNQPNWFLNAVIKIDNVLWKGSVLVNLKISDWVKHRYEYDQGYDNVLMHVLWDNDQPDLKMQKPVLYLKSKITSAQLEKVQHWFNIESVLWGWGERLDSSEVVKKAVQVDIKGNNEANNLDNINEPDSIKWGGDNQFKENEDEIKIIDCLHTLLESFKKKGPIIRGNVRSLKIITWHRQTIRFYVQYGGHAKHVPRLILLGNWLTKAGFDCDKRVSVIPLKGMLIIIPQKQ